MINDRKGFEQKGVASSSKGVGAQGTGGAKKGKKVMEVNNPRGIEPQKIGGGRMPLSQGAVEPKVGK